MILKQLTEDEINQLAEDIYKERVFTSMQVQPVKCPQVFLPLIFAGQEFMMQLLKEGPGLMYEHLSEAGPYAMDGLPMFVSFHVISMEDTKKVLKRVEQIKKAVQAVRT